MHGAARRIIPVAIFFGRGLGIWDLGFAKAHTGFAGVIAWSSVCELVVEARG
jgi:hypothetical protein